MQKKVGIVSCYFKNNYGSQLQAYATQKVIQDMGYETETIECEQNIDFKAGKKKYYKSQITNISFIKSKLGMIKLKIDKKINRDLGKNIAIRDGKYKEFKKNYKLSNTYITYDELSEMSKKYASILVGSDQLWLPVNVVSDYYTLNWVPDNINKISYSTSFGISAIPEKYNNEYKKFLDRINFLSTREETGVKIIKNVFNRDAKLVCDPTLLLDKDEWMCIQEEKPFVEEKYILCYFLGSNIEHRKFAERLKEKTGYKIVSLNHCDEYVKYSDKFADIIPYNVGPGEFLNLIRNAEYVCTDSFHGTVFSLIYNKVFFDFRRHNGKNKNNTNSRLDSLLNAAGVSNERILVGTEDIDVALNYKIDYEKVNENLKRFRNDSKDWLKYALKNGDNEDDGNKFVDIKEKANCCGCTACKNICPQNAIEMAEDEEGFLYPNIDKSKCVNCGLCRNVCPVLNAKEVKKEQKAYVLNHKDGKIRAESTSGGTFTAIANYVLEKDGIIFGAAFDKKFNVCHRYIENKEDLHMFRGSKYVQSDLKDTFKETKEFLENGRMVCFSGTPCQIEGLKRYLKKEYKNLITVDVMCHAVPSPLIWEKYKAYIKEEKLNNEDIENVLFRDKRKYGFKYSMMTIESETKKYSEGVDTDPYLRAFFGDYSDRPSCYNCKFKKQYHVSDFTIWDCFVAENFDKSLDDDKGTSRMLINSEKGNKIFASVKSNFNYKEVKTEKLVINVKEMSNSVKIPTKRKGFFYDISKKEPKTCFKEYFPNNFKTKIEKAVRVFLAKTGTYKKIKRIAKKVLGR